MKKQQFSLNEQAQKQILRRWPYLHRLHPRWNEFLDRLEEALDKTPCDSMSLTQAHQVASDMGLTLNEEFCKRRGAGCSCEIFLNLEPEQLDYFGELGVLIETEEATQSYLRGLLAPGLPAVCECCKVNFRSLCDKTNEFLKANGGRSLPDEAKDFAVGFMNLHIKIPREELTPVTKTSPEDFALVCPSCDAIMRRMPANLEEARKMAAKTGPWPPAVAAARGACKTDDKRGLSVEQNETNVPTDSCEPGMLDGLD